MIRTVFHLLRSIRFGGFFIAEDGTTFLLAEDGTTYLKGE